MSYKIATDREGRRGVNSSVFDKKKILDLTKIGVQGGSQPPIRWTRERREWNAIAQKALADRGAASLCFHGRLLSALVSSMARRLLATTSRIRNENEEKKETKKNSSGYLSLSCAPLGKCRLSLGLWYLIPNSLSPSLGCTCFRLDQLLASAS